MKIDFVLLWVDGDDSEWLEEYKKYSLEKGDQSIVRFRDWDLLKYWFRGVEKYASWVDKIHFITCGHYPEWLNLNHPKLNFVTHSDYIPSDFLPTFNSNVIELNLHRLPELSENFVLFNDDFFIINKIYPYRFFKKGLPCDMGVMNALSYASGIGHTILNNIEIINNNFNKKNVLKRNFSKWFNFRYGFFNLRNLCLLPWPAYTGFYDHHLPEPFLKSRFQELWDNNIIEKKHMTKFRDHSNINQYLVRYWNLMSGTFAPKRLLDDSIFFSLDDNSLKEACDIIGNQKKSIIVLNDTESINFEFASKLLIKSFEKILPEKSSFEI